MTEGTTSTTQNSVPSPFANAPVLPFDLSAQWFARSRSVAWHSPFFLLAATFFTLLARWRLDLFGSGELIVLSYLSDAIVFTWVFMGVAALHDPSASPLREGRLALAGRWRVLALCSLWGLPAAAVSHAMFAYAPDLIKALVLAMGSNLAGLATLLVVVMTAAYLTFLLSMLPVLAAIQAGRDVHANFKISGLWAMRALRAGHRPLAAVFVTFITGCVLAGAGLTYLYGHLPVKWLQENPGLDTVLSYWYAWPGLFVALYVFLALLHPMATDLLAAADQDLSDEIFSNDQKTQYGERHIGWVLCQFGFGMRVLAAFTVLLFVVYESIGGAADYGSGLGAAVVLFVVGKWLTSKGKARSESKKS